MFLHGYWPVNLSYGFVLRLTICRRTDRLTNYMITVPQKMKLNCAQSHFLFPSLFVVTWTYMHSDLIRHLRHRSFPDEVLRNRAKTKDTTSWHGVRLGCKRNCLFCKDQTNLTVCCGTKKGTPGVGKLKNVWCRWATANVPFFFFFKKRERERERERERRERPWNWLTQQP